MSKTDAYYLRQMLDYALKLSALAARTTREAYDSDETIRAACRYWLQVIGEAARGVSAELEHSESEIPWRAMIGMRNRIVHDYLGIDDDMVWNTVIHRIPLLILRLEALFIASDHGSGVSD